MKNPLKNVVKKITSSENVKNVISNVMYNLDDKIDEKVVAKSSQNIKQTVADINSEISAMEVEHKRKNLENMNRIKFNSNHLSDAQLRTFINDSSLDKFERIGYVATFADRYSDRNG